MQISRFGLAIILVSISGLYGCAATQVAISKRDLDVQTRMSATIFLDPVKEAQRTVFVQVRNTSDHTDLTIEPDVALAITNRGYRVVTDPDEANYVVQANVLQVGKTSPTAVQSALVSGYGGPGATGIMLAGAAYAGGNSSSRALAGVGLLGAAAEVVSGAMIKDVYYSIITDIQIKEKSVPGYGSGQFTAQPGTGYQRFHVGQPSGAVRLEDVPDTHRVDGKQGQSGIRRSRTGAARGTDSIHQWALLTRLNHYAFSPVSPLRDRDGDPDAHRMRILAQASLQTGRTSTDHQVRDRRHDLGSQGSSSGGHSAQHR